MPEAIGKSNEPILSTTNGLFVSVSPDLQNINAYRYQRQISGGIQEYVEAMMFQYYLETQCVMTPLDAASTIAGECQLMYDDYLGGLFDMTGELMRFAITYLAMNGSLPVSSSDAEDKTKCTNILTDLQSIRAQLETLDICGSYILARDYGKKLETTRTSVEKVENGVYSMIVRGKERPKGWRPDLVTGPPRAGDIEIC